MEFHRLARLEKQLVEVEDLIIEALHTDGAHHKQWYLEKIAETLEIDLSKEDYDQSIAP